MTGNSKIGAIIEESIRIERKLIQLIAKVLPIMEHYICTSFGASAEYYRGVKYKLAWTGQGNVISENVCRDTSNLIIKHIENMNLGIIIKGPISKEEENETAVVFVDDTDFGSDGDECESKIQIILNIHTNLFEAIGGEVQPQKTNYFCWKWIRNNGKLIIKDI